MNFAGATASASAQQEQNQAISEKDLRNQPSLGFTSAIHEAFDRAEDQVRPTPNPAAISTIGHSTSGVTITMNPIINNGREESSVQPNRMNVSVMREFLESGEKFSWPPELGDLSGNHCDLKSQVIPLRWKRKIQDRESSIDQYEANPEYHFGFRKSFVVKTRRDLSTRKNHERTAIEVKNMKDLRHPHVIALLGTFTLHKRSNILIFPAPCCDLQQYMKQTSRDLQDIGDQSHQTHALSQVVTSSNGRGSPESSTGSTSSQGSRYGSEAMGYQKRLKNHPRKKSDVWPLNTSLQFKMASLRGYFVCLSQALRYIHESGVLHKDIKPTNIWIDESGSVILTNFEISQRLPKDIPYDASGQWSFTRRYASPEVMKHGNIPTGYPSDVFSLGCVFLEIMTLLLGHESTDFIATVEDDTYLNNAYYCNLDKVSSWIGILRESHWSENVSLRLTQNRRNEGQGSSPTAESSTIDALIPIQRMLAENPQARPSSRGLWADFQSVNSTICPDCDPRHPQAWGSEQVAGLDSHDNESEVSSIASINAPSLFTGSTLSSTNSFMEVQGTAEEFAKVLLTDEILGPLYVVALHRIDIERLERNLARLLTSYAKDLRVEATTDLERIAVKFARRYAQSVASHLCTSLNPSRNARYMEMQQLSAHVVQNEESIEHFLQQVVESGTRDHFSHTTQAFHDTTLETKNEHSDDSESDAENCQNLSNLSNVKAFMTESKAFAGLRENFRTFVTPVSGDRDQKRVDQELAEKHPESVPTSDDSKEISENREQEDVDQELVGDHLQSAPNSDDSKETTDTNSTTTDSSETQTSHIDIAFEESIKAPWYNRSCDILKEVVSLTAEFLKVREKPLRYGMERVRWTCVCGRRLFDDFFDVSPAAIEELRDYLDCCNGPTGRITIGPNLAGQVESQCIINVSSNPISSTDQPLQIAPPTPEKFARDDSSNGLRRLRRHRASGSLRVSYDLQSSGRWIFPIFQRNRHGTKLIHIPVGARDSDESLFLALNRHYSQSTNRFLRYLSLRGVIKIHYVKFVFTHRGPDIKATNSWPLQRHCPPWTYMGCPAKKKEALVGESLLMHLWQYPHHSDRHSYQSHQSRSSHVARAILCYLRTMLPGNNSDRWYGRAEEGTQRHTLGNAEETSGNTGSAPVAAVEDNIGMTNFGRGTVLRDVETQTENRPSSYVFLRTPKKLGEKLLPNDVNPPEGWGMYFEEGLRVSRLYMFILLLYLLGTLVFGIIWYREFGMAGPQSGFGAFGISGWMVGLISFITMVMFKWAE